MACRENIHGSREIDPLRKHHAVKVLVRLAANLTRWAFWVMAFRVCRTNGIFERARHAAFSSGRTLETLRTGRNSVRIYFTVGRIVLAVRRLALRLCPGFV